MTLLANENSAGGSNAEATGWYPAIGGATQANGGSGGIDLYRETFRARLEKLALGSQPGVTAGRVEPRRRWLSVSSRRALALLAMLCLAPTSEAGVTRSAPAWCSWRASARPRCCWSTRIPTRCWCRRGSMTAPSTANRIPRWLRSCRCRPYSAWSRDASAACACWLPARPRHGSRIAVLAEHLRDPRKPPPRPLAGPAHGHPANPDEGAVPPARPASARRGRGRRTGLRAARETLRVDNPTPYFVSLAGLALEIETRLDLPGTLLAPRSQRRLGLPRRVDSGRAARWRSTGSTTTASAARKGKLYSEQFPTGSPARAPAGRCRLPGRRPAPGPAFPGRPGARSGAPGLAGRTACRASGMGAALPGNPAQGHGRQRRAAVADPGTDPGAGAARPGTPARSLRAGYGPRPAERRAYLAPGLQPVAPERGDGCLVGSRLPMAGRPSAGGTAADAGADRDRRGRESRPGSSSDACANMACASR